VIVSLPEVDLSPDQAPLAEHEEVLLDDQVIVNSSPSKTVVEEAEMVTEADGVGAGVGAEEPPPPPPPQEIKKKLDNTKEIILFI
jgi:hypothetical protein